MAVTDPIFRRLARLVPDLCLEMSSEDRLDVDIVTLGRCGRDALREAFGPYLVEDAVALGACVALEAVRLRSLRDNTAFRGGPTLNFKGLIFFFAFHLPLPS